jgi:transcriptional regulator of acetoin/glycerol metabolism
VLEVADYPANVRDLREVVKAGYLRARGSEELRVEHLPEWIRVPLRYNRRMDPATKLRLVALALRASGGHVGEAAERIGVHRNTVAALVAQFRRAKPTPSQARPMAHARS